jgi:hypothetical protein
MSAARSITARRRSMVAITVAALAVTGGMVTVSNASSVPGSAAIVASHARSAALAPIDLRRDASAISEPGGFGWQARCPVK